MVAKHDPKEIKAKERQAEHDKLVAKRVKARERQAARKQRKADKAAAEAKKKADREALFAQKRVETAAKAMADIEANTKPYWKVDVDDRPQHGVEGTTQYVDPCPACYHYYYND